MALIIKGNVKSATAHSEQNNVATSINGKLSDENGNVNISFNEYMSGETGDTITFKQDDIYKISKLVNIASIITLDEELNYVKAVSDNNIFDARTGEVWIKENSVWNISASTLYEILEKGCIYTNTFTNRAFIINENNTVSNFSGISKGTGVGQVPGIENFNSTIDGDLFFITQKLPSGFIMQTVRGITDSNGYCSLELPIALENKILAVTTESIDVISAIAGNTYIVNFDLNSSTNTHLVFNAKVVNINGVSPVSTTFNAIVIGY